MARRKRSSRSRAQRSSQSSMLGNSGKDKTGMWVALILAVVAIAGLVLLYSDATTKPQGNAVLVQGLQESYPQAGLTDAQETGWNLGNTLVQNWDKSEVREYCSRQCGTACSESVTMEGDAQRLCYQGCENSCRTGLSQNW